MSKFRLFLIRLLVGESSYIRNVTITGGEIQFRRNSVGLSNCSASNVTMRNSKGDNIDHKFIA